METGWREFRRRFTGVPDISCVHELTAWTGTRAQVTEQDGRAAGDVNAGAAHGTPHLEADWALATTTYKRIAADLTTVNGEGQTLRIVLDDGLPHESGV